MSNTISKSALIEWLDKEIDLSGGNHEVLKAYQWAFQRVKKGAEKGKFDTDCWISVKERLPEQEGEYLVHRSPYYHDIVSYENDTWIGVGLYGELIKAINVTHWMPLPEPPKGEDNE